MEHECPDCHREFKTGPALISHRRVHQVQPNDTNIGSVTASWHSEELEEVLVQTEELEEMIEIEKVKNLIEESLPDLSSRPVDPDTYAPTIVKIKKLPHGYDLPDLKRATAGSAAVDLYAAVDTPVCVGANERVAIPTGFAIEVPEGFVAKIAPRSGLAFNNGVSLVNTPGIIDSDYRGEVKLSVINHSHSKFWVNRGDRVAQMLIERVEPVEFEYVEELSSTERGTGGFGSTGIR